MEHSQTIGNIAAALAKAQANIKPAAFDRVNPHFKNRYATLGSVIDSIKVELSRNEISVVQGTDLAEDGALVCETMLLHSSGEWIKSRLRLSPRDNSPQSVGSALTYARRYLLAAMACNASDEDDDGNAASPNGNGKQTSRASSSMRPQFETISEHPAAPPARATDDVEIKPIAEDDRLWQIYKHAVNIGIDAEEVAQSILHQPVKIQNLTHEQKEIVLARLKELSKPAAPAAQTTHSEDTNNPSVPSIPAVKPCSGKNALEVARLAKTLGHRDKASIVKVVSEIVGREIQNASALTADEAEKCISELRNRIDHANDEVRTNVEARRHHHHAPVLPAGFHPLRHHARHPRDRRAPRQP